MKSHAGQFQRISEHFERNPNIETPSPMLHKIGSGSSWGYCSSISKRISECRKHFESKGGQLLKTKDVINQETMSRETAYTYIPAHNTEILVTSATPNEIFIGLQPTEQDRREAVQFINQQQKELLCNS